MIRYKAPAPRFSFSLLVALVIHLAVFLVVKKESLESQIFSLMNEKKSRPLTIDRIQVLRPAEVEKFRRVGIKEGNKNAMRPDLPLPRPALPPGAPKISLDKLGPQVSAPPPLARPPSTMATTEKKAAAEGGHFYFNPKKEKIIPPSPEQELLKSAATKGLGPSNKATESISNFEIRYDRPEGVSEDELNSDEKAYYSFYVRSYKNYYSKIYSTYEKIIIERPGLARALEGKHLLIGKIDYDEQGNIVTVKIIKSSTNDDLHYFFEETLKQLEQPNPPKVFTKNQKQFSIYYQIKVN